MAKYWKKLRKTLNTWYNRGLTLIGKVQVINTLIASLFVYKMMVLPLIPKDIVKNINNIIRNFIWNNKKAKIAYNILQLPKRQGGLGLVNLEHKEYALKATWPQILQKEPEYAQIVYSLIHCSVLQEDIWRCSIAPEDVKGLRISSEFWRNVLWCWSNYNYYYQMKEENQLIWLNSRIRVKGKPFMWADVYKRGLRYVYQLFEKGTFKSSQQVWEEYGLTQLRHNSLKVSIPKEWITIFTTRSQQTFLPVPPHNYDIAIITEGIGLSRKIYKYISEDISSIQYKYVKWVQDIGPDFCENIEEFANLHMDIYRTTNVPKYRSFQYRLLQRGLVTNVHLHKWNMIPNSMCTYCQSEVETVCHLFVECPMVRTLWEKVLEYIQYKFETKDRIEINAKNIICNKISPTSSDSIIFICLITKQYIYRQRCQKGNIHFNNLRTVLHQVENIEKKYSFEE